MRKMMDSVQFSFENSRNQLTMVKMSKPVPSDEEPFAEFHEIQHGVWQVAPDGRLDAATSPALETSLSRILSKGTVWIIVDMTHVTYVASRGLKTLVSAWRNAGDSGGNLVLFGMAKRVVQVFETVGFLHLFDVYANEEEALAAFLNHQK
jgi:anti-sigma B factor antagonist